VTCAMGLVGGLSRVTCFTYDLAREAGDGALVQGWGKRLKTRDLTRWEYCVTALSV
jgi:hypothetical protein